MAVRPSAISSSASTGVWTCIFPPQVIESLARGTAVLFDTGQPHAVIKRHSDGFNVADFAPDQDCTQVFLTWELPIENANVRRALRIDFDIDPWTSLQLDEEQVWLNGARASVCPDSGRWCRADYVRMHDPNQRCS